MKKRSCFVGLFALAGCALIATTAFAQSNDPTEAIKEIDNLEQQVFSPGNARKANQDLAAYCKKIGHRLTGLDRSVWEPVVRHCTEAMRRMTAYNSGTTPQGATSGGTGGGAVTAGPTDTGTKTPSGETPTPPRYVAAGRPRIPNVTVPSAPRFCSDAELQAWVNNQIRPRLNEIQSALNALQNYNSQLYDEKWYSKPPATPAELNQIAAAQAWHDREVAALQKLFDEILDLWRNAKVEDCGQRGGALQANPPRVGMLPNGFAPSGGALPYTFEGRFYGGGVDASSFGMNFHPGVWGGGAALRIPYDQLRWQVDLQGEGTGNYSSLAGYRSYFAGGTHLDWAWRPGGEIGVFGGLQDATPTFFGQENTNYFAGLEGRQFLGPIMLGAQGGYFNDASGPGTLIHTGFIEGRAKISVGEALGLPDWRQTIVGFNVGHGSGTSSATLTGAQTSYWGMSLSQAIGATPFSLTLEYQHFDNRVSGLGTVWNENMIMGGVKVLLPNTGIMHAWKEPTEPLPFILREVSNF